MTEKETYQVIAECKNCGHTPKEIADGMIIGPLRYKIPKGTPAAMYLQHKDCPNCGCRGTLRRHF
jgi:hypothetical protein